MYHLRRLGMSLFAVYRQRIRAVMVRPIGSLGEQLKPTVYTNRRSHQPGSLDLVWYPALSRGFMVDHGQSMSISNGLSSKKQVIVLNNLKHITHRQRRHMLHYNMAILRFNSEPCYAYGDILQVQLKLAYQQLPPSSHLRLAPKGCLCNLTDIASRTRRSRQHNSRCPSSSHGALCGAGVLVRGPEEHMEAPSPSRQSCAVWRPGQMLPVLWAGPTSADPSDLPASTLDSRAR